MSSVTQPLTVQLVGWEHLISWWIRVAKWRDSNHGAIYHYGIVLYQLLINFKVIFVFDNVVYGPK